MAKIAKIAAVLFLMTMTATGCKEESDNTSSDKTLTDFAAGRTASGLNTCGDVKRNSYGDSLTVIADPAVENGEQLVSQYRAKVEEYFEGLPPYYASTFVGKLGGMVVLTDSKNFNTLCVKNKDVTPERAKDIAACYGYQANPNGQSTLAVIHRIDADVSKEKNEQNIRHGGVRAFGMVFSQFLARHDIETDATKLKNGINLNFKDSDVDGDVAALKTELATKFIVDVVANSKYSVETFSPILGSNLSTLSHLAKQLAAGGNTTSLLSDAKIPSAAAQQFLDYVFAEAFDSAYCNNETAVAAKNDFKRSFGDYESATGVFKRLEAAVQKHTDKVLAYAVANSPASDSLTLTDGYSLQGATCNCPCCNGGTCAGGCSCGNCSQCSGNCNAQPIDPAAARQQMAAAGSFIQQLLLGILRTQSPG